MSDSFVNNKGRLEERVNLFNQMALPGQPLSMHIGTSYLVNDLMREIQELREALKPFGLGNVDLEAADDIYVSYRNKGGEKVIVPSVLPLDFRNARAKLEGGSND